MDIILVSDRKNNVNRFIFLSAKLTQVWGGIQAFPSCVQLTVEFTLKFTPLISLKSLTWCEETEEPGESSNSKQWPHSEMCECELELLSVTLQPTTSLKWHALANRQPWIGEGGWFMDISQSLMHTVVHQEHPELSFGGSSRGSSHSP